MKSDLGKSNKNIIFPASSVRMGDVVSIIIILAIAVGLILFFRLSFGDSGVKYAEISVTVGEETSVCLYSLNQNKIIEFESLEYHFTAEISDGSISVTKAECPDGICRNTPSISSEREAIICVPAKMIIKIISDSNNSNSSLGKEDFDYVAY